MGGGQITGRYFRALNVHFAETGSPNIAVRMTRRKVLHRFRVCSRMATFEYALQPLKRRHVETDGSRIDRVVLYEPLGLLQLPDK
jgi:hypothetical protein